MADSPSTRVVIVGAGRFGELHARVWTELGARIVGFVDVRAERAAELAATFGASAHGVQLADVLAQTAADVVVVASDESSHAEITQSALTAGANVFVEKPFALSRADAERTVDIAEERGLHAFAGQISRFAQPYSYLREAIRSGRLGDVWALRLRRDFPRSWFDDFGSRVHPVWESCIHDIDLAVYLTEARPARVFALKSSAAGDAAPSVVTALIEFDNGVIATIESAWAISDRAPQTISGALNLSGTIAGECEVIGSAGTIKQRLVSDAISEWNSEGVVAPDLALWPEVNGRIGGALRDEVAEALAVFRGEKQNERMPHHEAVWGVAVAQGIVQSLETRQPIDLY